MFLKSTSRHCFTSWWLTFHFVGLKLFTLLSKTLSLFIYLFEIPGSTTAMFLGEQAPMLWDVTEVKTVHFPSKSEEVLIC